MSKKAIVLIIVIAIIVLGSIGYGWYEYIKIHQLNTELNTSNDSNKTTQTQSSNSNTNNDPDQSVSSDTNTSEYRSYLYKYLINYPSSAKLADVADPKAADIHNAKCVKISTDNYYVLIGSSSENLEDSGFCFRTGVGSDWSNGPSDTVTAAGQSYTQEGMHTEAASAGYYQDFFSFATVDGRVRIEYGINVNEKYGTITKAEARDIVHQIIASYSPAE